MYIGFAACTGVFRVSRFCHDDLALTFVSQGKDTENLCDKCGCGLSAPRSFHCNLYPLKLPDLG